MKSEISQWRGLLFPAAVLAALLFYAGVIGLSLANKERAAQEYAAIEN
jgi:hypothetical protein